MSQIQIIIEELKKEAESCQDSAFLNDAFTVVAVMLQSLAARLEKATLLEGSDKE